MNHTDARRPLVLLSNDDGIASPGLWALAEAIQPFAEVLVAAPSRQQSGASRSRFVFSDAVEHRSVTIHGEEIRGVGLDMTPAQAVYEGVSRLASRRPSLIIAGINYGENLGSGITGSGTVGAAVEGAAWDIPSMAVSLETGPEYHYSYSEDIDFSVAAYVAGELARRVLAFGLPEGVDILKVDLPKGVTRQTPWRLTRQSRKRILFLTRDTDGENAAIVSKGRHDDSPTTSSGGATNDRGLDLSDVEPDSDIHVLFVDRQVSICPLSTDLSASLRSDGMDALLHSS